MPKTTLDSWLIILFNDINHLVMKECKVLMPDRELERMFSLYMLSFICGNEILSEKCYLKNKNEVDIKFYI